MLVVIRFPVKSIQSIVAMLPVEAVSIILKLPIPPVMVFGIFHPAHSLHGIQTVGLC